MYKIVHRFECKESEIECGSVGTRCVISFETKNGEMISAPYRCPFINCKARFEHQTVGMIMNDDEV